jgi:hypothetical protein
MAQCAPLIAPYSPLDCAVAIMTRTLGAYGHPTLESVFSGDDKRPFVIDPYNRRRLINLFNFKTVKLPIERKTQCLFASSKNERYSALIASHYPNSNGGIVHRHRADGIPRILNHQGTQPKRQNCKHYGPHQWMPAGPASTTT